MGITTDSRTEAQTWVREMLDQIQHGMTFKDTNQPLADYLKDWIELKGRSLKPRTAYQYECLITKLISPRIGQIKLKNVTQKTINGLYSLMIREGKSARLIRYVHAVLHAAFEQALTDGILARNPAHHAILPRQNHPEMMILSEQQVNQFLVAAKDSRHRMLYHLALSTGMRQAELFGLKWADVDWLNGSIKIQRQAQRVEGHGIQFSEPKTKAGRRTIKLGDNLLMELRKHRERIISDEQQAGINWVDFDLVFPTTIGTPIYQSNLLKDFHRILRESGLPNIRFHDLRHTAASLMINRGIPVIVVSKMLGHSQPSVTLNIYSHCMLEMQTQAADVMDDITISIPIELESSSKISSVIEQNDTGLHAVAREIDPQILK